MVHIVAARGFQQRKSAENRVGPEVHGLHLNHRNCGLIAGVVSRPLAERPFGRHILDCDFTFDGDLCIRRQR